MRIHIVPATAPGVERPVLQPVWARSWPVRKGGPIFPSEHEATAMAQAIMAFSYLPTLPSESEPMGSFYHDGPVERSSQGVEAGESVRRRRIGGVTRIPDDKEVVADFRYPVEPKIEVHPLVLVVVLNEAQE